MSERLAELVPEPEQVIEEAPVAVIGKDWVYSPFSDEGRGKGLLTKQEEFSYGVRIQNALELRRSVDDDLSCLSEEQMEAVEYGREIFERFSLRNIGLAVKGADERFKIDPRAKELGFEMLKNEAIIGMRYAIIKFDPHKGFKFSTYAFWWIQNHMHKALEPFGNDVAKIPNIVLSKIRQMEELSGSSDEAIMEELNVDEDGLTMLIGASSLNNVVHLEARLGEQEGSTVGDLLRAGGEDDVHKEVAEIRDGEAVQELLGVLDLGEAEIIKLHFGLEEREPLDLKEIATKFNMPYPQVIKTKNSALRKLQANAYTVGLDPQRGKI